MINIEQSYKTIVSELVKPATPEALANKSPSFPGLIAAGEAGSVITNEQIDLEIGSVATWLLQQKPQMKAQYTKKEWESLVRRTFGPAIVLIDLYDDKAATKLRALVENALDSNPSIVSANFTTIGCTLFYRPIAEALTIGPVIFEPKPMWLQRSVANEHFDESRRKRLERAFAGQKLRATKKPMLDALESSILSVLAKAQLACTIETNGLAPEMAQQRAIVGARLAQTAIALLWALPSKTLNGFHLSVESGYRQIRTIPFHPDRLMIGGPSSLGSPSGPDIAGKKLEAIISDARELLDIAGKMVACWTSSDAHDQASPCLKQLAQSIFFFSEGCRERDNLMSIVKFTASLEALSKDQSSSGIKKLIKARLGIAEDKPIINQQTVKELVNLIYSDARSRTLHGTNLDILHDWSRVRTSAESLARHCLVRSMDAYCDDPSIVDFGKT